MPQQLSEDLHHTTTSFEHDTVTWDRIGNTFPSKEAYLVESRESCSSYWYNEFIIRYMEHLELSLQWIYKMGYTEQFFFILWNKSSCLILLNSRINNSLSLTTLYSHCVWRGAGTETDTEREVCVWHTLRWCMYWCECRWRPQEDMEYPALSFF